MTFSPMNIPPGTGFPSNDQRKWYRRGWLWLLVLAVAIGAFIYAR